MNRVRTDFKHDRDRLSVDRTCVDPTRLGRSAGVQKRTTLSAGDDSYCHQSAAIRYRLVFRTVDMSSKEDRRPEEGEEVGAIDPRQGPVPTEAPEDEGIVSCHYRDR